MLNSICNSWQSSRLTLLWTLDQKKCLADNHLLVIDRTNCFHVSVAILRVTVTKTSTVHLKHHSILCIIFSHANLLYVLLHQWIFAILHGSSIFCIFCLISKGYSYSAKLPQNINTHLSSILPVEHCSLSSSVFQSQCCDKVKVPNIV